MTRRRRVAAALVVGALIAVGCSGDDEPAAVTTTSTTAGTATSSSSSAVATTAPPSMDTSSTAVPSTAVPATTAPVTSESTTSTTPGSSTSDVELTIPPVTVPGQAGDRALAPGSFLRVASAEGFESSIGPVPASVLARSSWRPECPVDRDELVYLTVTHWGFDGRRYVGEVITNAAFGPQLVTVFERLHDLEFPIEELRVLTLDEVTTTTPPSDTNTSSSFECRSSVGSSRWSRHAYGLALDINPFHNPYLRGDVVLPTEATAYLDRDPARPGMIGRGDGVVEAFDSIGWSWGGEWRSLKDWMHFSDDGR